MEDYVQLIAIYEHAEIYRARLPDIAEEEISVSEEFEDVSMWGAHTSDSQWVQREVSVWTEEANRINLRSFDQVIVLSEDAINALFRSLWAGIKTSGSNVLQFWSEAGFEGKFGHMKVKLLSGDCAVVYVTIDKATMDFNARFVFCQWSV